MTAPISSRALQAIEKEGLPGRKSWIGTARAITSVEETSLPLRHTHAAHGLTQHELRRLSGAIHLMGRKRLPLVWAVIGDAVLDLEASQAREAFSAVRSFITQYQNRSHLPAYCVELLEVQTGLHSNLIFPATSAIVASLRQAFPLYLVGTDAVQPVDDPTKLARIYLAKERTPQASWALGLPIKPGRYPIEGGGDRVRLSDALKHDAIAAGLVEPWKGKNANRKPRKLDGRRLRWFRDLKPTGQLLLFPDLPKPRERLDAFRGGYMSPVQSLEAEFHRRRLGLTQGQIAAQAGLSQPFYANLVRGRYGASPQVAQRLVFAVFTGQERGIAA